MNIELARRQRASLWLEGREGLRTEEEARLFLDEVGLALRYDATDSLPLASMYRATQRQIPIPEDAKTAHARAFELTNALLASGEAVEINVIANRLALAHPRVLPAIYALRRGDRIPELSDVARRAFEFIGVNHGASSGDVRRHLSVIGQARPDPGDLALTALQRELLVDRGPSSVPDGGIFYLSKEGYPYRIFGEAHADVIATAAGLERAGAVCDLLAAYLAGAVFVQPRKLYSMFQLLLSREDIDAALAAMVDGGQAERVPVERGPFVYVG